MTTAVSAIFCLFERCFYLDHKISCSFSESISITFDRDTFYNISLTNSVYDFLIAIIYHVSKNAMFPIKPRCFDMGDEKLRTISSWTRVSHTQDTRSCMTKFRMKLVTKLVAWTSSTSTIRTATLYHEIFYNTVKE